MTIHFSFQIMYDKSDKDQRNEQKYYSNGLIEFKIIDAGC